MNLATSLADLPKDHQSHTLIFQIGEQAQRGKGTGSGSHSMARRGLGQEPSSPNSDGIVSHFLLELSLQFRPCSLRATGNLRGLVGLIHPFTLSFTHVC